MGQPRFDFTPAREEEQQQPQRRLPGFQDKVGRVDPAWIYSLLGLFAGIVVAVILSRFRRPRPVVRSEENSAWREVHEIAVEHNLTADEERILTEALREAGVATPARALTSASRFNVVAAPMIARRIGRQHCERIRRKLFFGGIMAEESPQLGGTHELQAGQRLRLHFHGCTGTHTCTVINVAARSFVVTLPLTGNRHVHPRKGEIVEGYMELGNALYAFESIVEETFLGGVFACRIRHPANVSKSHQRDATRVRTAERITFSHFAGANIETGHIALESLQDQLTDRHEGVLRDISVGGGAIATPSRRGFQVGDFVQFTVSLLVDEPEQPVLGQVVHISPIPTHEGGGRILHIQFLGLDDNAQGSITRAVHRMREDEQAEE